MISKINRLLIETKKKVLSDVWDLVIYETKYLGRKTKKSSYI